MKCKSCGVKFTPKRFLQKHCMLNEECTDAEIKMVLDNNRRLAEKKDKKDWNEKKSEMKIDTHAKEYKKSLQNEINKLSRIIDLKFEYLTCIDCNKNYGSQQDAAHFHGRGSNSTLKYHLHNLHSANSQCNRFSDVHHVNYKIGLEKRYGKEYLQYVEDLKANIKSIDLSNKDIVDKLKIVRDIIRHFDTYQFESSLDARTILNGLIGIYDK